MSEDNIRLLAPGDGGDNGRGNGRGNNYGSNLLGDDNDNDNVLQVTHLATDEVVDGRDGPDQRKKPPKQCCGFQVTKSMMIAVSCAIAIVLVTVALGLGFGLARDGKIPQPGPVSPAQGKETSEAETSFESFTVKPQKERTSVLGKYSRAAISVDAEPCAKIGMDVLLRNGTAVDAAIAALFCNGVINSHSMGIGGGFLMTIYDRRKKQSLSLNARESAPKATTPDMYKGNPDAAQNGPLAAGVPGEILGYWEARQKYGNKESITWKSLIEPTIEMCRNGIPVTFSAAAAMREQEMRIFNDPGLREIYINPATNRTWVEGDSYKRVNFANTLESIANNGPNEFYRGRTARNLVRDIQKGGGIITMEDMKDYKVTWDPSLEADFDGGRIFSVPPPGSGSILILILNILSHYGVKPGHDDPLLYHRIAEAFKWGYGQRTQLGDPLDDDIADSVNELVSNMISDRWSFSAFKKIDDNRTYNDPAWYGGEFFGPDDHGTAHVSVLAPNGDAVSVTSTVNLYFGCRYMSPSTGIIVNSEMDDFSFPGFKNYFGLPPSPANLAKPGKRPLSSMSPAIITDGNDDARLVIGAAGGSRITTAIAYAIVRNMWLKEDIKTAIDARRIHHQLVPMELEHEEQLGQEIVDFLKSRGHKVKSNDIGDSIVCGIEKAKDGQIFANADFRKAGGVAGI